MSDSEDADFFVESWTLPQTIKVKKKFKQGKKDQTVKSRTSKTHERAQDKKKNLTCKKERMKSNEKKKEKTKENRKKKNKGKKKKKHKLALELDDHLEFMQASCAQAKLKERSKVANPCQKKKLSTDNLAQDSMKKTKRKKRVAFGLSPNFIRVKRPKFTSSSPKDIESMEDAEGCLGVTVTGHSQIQAYDNDSQSTGDDINSQDLFITQKTFRASPREPSSSESSEGAVTASLQAFMQRDKDLFTATGERKPSPGESGKAMKSRVNLSGADAELTVVNPYLDKRVAINRIPAAFSRKYSSLCPPFINESTLLTPSTVSTSTQTENFFTAELPSYISFSQKSRVTADLENLKPLDLSLPQRVRRDLCWSVKMSVMDRNNDGEEPHDQETSLLMGETKNRLDIGPSGSPQITQIEIKDESSCQGETTPSPKSEADPRSVDSTASSEDDHLCRSGKRDLIQVRAVQMKLNKPFFFKTKGDGQSPRPESPLMKLSQGRDVKVKKGH